MQYAIYSGKQKPDSIDDYLEEFVNELTVLQEGRLIVNDKHYEIKLHSFICDAPARSFVKCVTGHTAKNGCERCNCVGESIERRIVFLNKEGDNRTDEAFRLNEYSKHKTNNSPVLRIVGFDIIKCFALESMHLLFLGVRDDFSFS